MWVHSLKHKGDFVDWFMEMDATFANQYGWHIGILQADNGGEYTNQWLKDYCIQHGISLELTVPHTLQQNGVTERANWTLTKQMHAMMKDTNCPMGLWGEAVWTVCQGTTSPPSFPASFLLHPLPLSSFTYFQLHPTPSTCPPTPLHLLQGILMQPHYIHCQTSLRLTLDLLGSSSHAKGYHLYTLV